ncbi:Aquaporin TIP4-4 [Chlamydiales bacterium STE3]|nr:Aquaporin TIP4-4 [Chlamydiales bacterium STE3]
MSIAWFLAELIGTFTLIFIGAGSVLVNQMTGGSLGIIGVAIAHGLAIAVMVSAIGHISGGKLNPAITLGLLFGGKISLKNATLEIIAQLLGAILGAFFLSQIFPASVQETVHLGVPSLGQGITGYVGIFTETILVFLLVFVVYATMVDTEGSFKIVGGFGIGCVILFDILAAASISGPALNPARAFGPALMSGFWQDQYVYWIGPILGGILAGLFYNYGILRNRKPL